jgi:catechol-2,3-dioxygenase
MAPPVKFAHVVYDTNRLDEMIAWYTKVLEARVVFAADFAAFLTYDDEHHRVAFAARPDFGDRPRRIVGVNHLAWTYAHLGDLLDTYARLHDDGITPAWVINHGPTTSMYYRDPDGNQLELQVDNFATAEELDSWFASGDFAKNPIGVAYDPDELLARYRAGEPPDVIVKDLLAQHHRLVNAEEVPS